MRRRILLATVLFLLFILGFNPPQTKASLSLYDDFQKPNIDPNKWSTYEFINEIQDGKLYSETVAYGARATNNLRFKNPTPINYIEADVTIKEMEDRFGFTSADSHTFPNAWLTGCFYNDGSASGPGSYKGEVQGKIGIKPFKGKLWVYWGWSKSTDDAGASEGGGGGRFPDPISLNTTYKLSIQFDPSSKTFIFRVGLTTRTWTSTDTIYPSNIPWKAIGTDVNFTRMGLYGRISATFDNVIAKDEFGSVVVSDDFSSPTIDPDKWNTLSRGVSDGKLLLKVDTNSDTRNSLEFKYPEQINEFQAKVALLDFKNPDGVSTRARLGGHFYNDTGDPISGYLGDVWAEVSIGGGGTAPSANWQVIRYTNSEGSAVTTLESGTFPIPVNLGETYNLLLGWDGSTFTFKCNDSVATYVPTGSKFPPNNRGKHLATRIQPADPDLPFEASISATFDEVMSDFSGTDKVSTLDYSQTYVDKLTSFSGEEGTNYDTYESGGWNLSCSVKGDFSGFDDDTLLRLQFGGFDTQGLFGNSTIGQYDTIGGLKAYINVYGETSGQYSITPGEKGTITYNFYYAYYPNEGSEAKKIKKTGSISFTWDRNGFKINVFAKSDISEYKYGWAPEPPLGRFEEGLLNGVSVVINGKTNYLVIFGNKVYAERDVNYFGEGKYTTVTKGHGENAEDFVLYESTVKAAITAPFCATPGIPSGPSPANNAYVFSTSPTLSWAANSNTDSYDVYFGTANPPPLLGNTTSTSYPASGLTINTTYYWKVVAKNNCGNSTAGSVWSLTPYSLTMKTITPTEGTYGTGLTITGSGFGTKPGKVLIGRASLKIEKWTDESIQGIFKKVLLPGPYAVTVQPKNPKGVEPITLQNAFTVKPAEIHSVDHGSGTAYDQVTIKGKFFGSKKGKVYLEYEKSGSLESVRKGCTVSYWHMDPTTGDSAIVFVVPVIPNVECDVIVDPYSTIEETEEKGGFTVKAPEIERVDPGTGLVGDSITISGKYFGSKKGKVYLGYVNVKDGNYTKKSCSVSSWPTDPTKEEGEIVFKVPKLPPGAYDVIVTNSVDSAKYSQKFNIE